MSEPETLDGKPPISIWKRTFVALGVFVGVLFALGFAQNWRERGRTSDELERVIAELDESEPGWRLDDLVAGQNCLPEGEDSAPVVMTVAKLMPKGWPDSKFEQRFQEVRLPLPQLPEAERMALLDSQMSALAAPLGTARRLADLPDGRHQVVHAANPLATRLPDYMELRRAAMLLQYDALHQAARGDMKQALRSCRGMLNTGRSVGDEPIVLAQQIRAHCVVMALSQTQRVLSLGEAPADELAELAKVLALEEQHPTEILCVGGERAGQHKMYQAMAEGTIQPQELFELLGRGSEMPGARWLGRLFGVSRAQIEEELAYALRMLTRYLAVVRLPTHERVAEEKRLKAEFIKQPARYTTRVLLPFVMQRNEEFRPSLALVRVTQALVAVERYRLANGRWPDKLADVAPKWLATVPLDPFDGKPMRYTRLADGVAVHSSMPVGRPLGYRLWDAEARRQPARPMAGGP